MNKKNIILLDADSLCYLGAKDDTLPQILEKVDYKINAILTKCKADYYCLFISKDKYFRHYLKDKSEIKGSYKANRTYKGQEYSKTIKEYLIAQYGAIDYHMAEADDVIAYWMNNKIGYIFDKKEYIEKWDILESARDYLEEDDIIYPIKEVNVILAAIDKDLLKAIPGKHLNYNKRINKDTWDMVWIETSEIEATNFYQRTLLSGDSSDGIPALKGIGEKRAIKLLEGWKEGHVESYILNIYIDFYNNIPKAVYEFQKTYRSLHLLNTDGDWMREIGHIPNLPEFREFKKEVESTTTFD